ncbi:MAG: hypothetical protein VW875_09290 [Planctomycetaceae bacterium]
MKRFSVYGLAVLMLVALVATTSVQADEESKKLVDLKLPKISLKKSGCCDEKKECCEDKDGCWPVVSKVFRRAKGLLKKTECTGKEDCPVCNAKKEDSDDEKVEDASNSGASEDSKLPRKATETAKNVTGKAGEVVKGGADRAKEVIGKLRERTEKMIERVKK